MSHFYPADVGGRRREAEPVTELRARGARRHPSVRPRSFVGFVRWSVRVLRHRGQGRSAQRERPWPEWARPLAQSVCYLYNRRRCHRHLLCSYTAPILVRLRRALIAAAAFCARACFFSRGFGRSFGGVLVCWSSLLAW